jgi:hypothetical protein
VASPSPTPVPQSQLINDWDWSLESQAAYQWAIERLRALGVTGTVGDVGAGTGEGAKMLQRAGYEVVCVDCRPHLVDELRKDKLYTISMTYNRQKVHGQGWDAVVMVGMLGYSSEWRKHIDAAMHDAPIILATVTGDVVKTDWMKPRPTLIPGEPWSYMEWKRV